MARTAQTLVVPLAGRRSNISMGMEGCQLWPCRGDGVADVDG
jgi:hypothetical protein